MIMTNGSVAHVDDLPIGCAHEETYPVDLEKKLFSEVKNGDADHAVATAETYFDLVAKLHGSYLMNIRLKVLEFVLYAEHLAYNSGGMTYEFRARSDYLPAIMEMDDIASIKKMVYRKDGDGEPECQHEGVGEVPGSGGGGEGLYPE